MGDRPRYRPERSDRAPWSLLLVLGVVCVGLAARAYWPEPTTVPTLVTVVGDVPRPGTYALERATVFAAIRAAGGEPSADQDAFVPAGHRVIVERGHGTIAPPSDPLLVGLPVDPNTATAEQLDALPGVGPATAARIVSHRQKHGRFRTLAAFERAVGSRSYQQLQPFIELSPVGRIDINQASPAELTTLPGVGEVLAERIVAERERSGPYTTSGDLTRVKGIGKRLANDLEGLLRF